MDAAATAAIGEINHLPLYSLISLMMGLFGATYTVIAALKNTYDSHVIAICKDADEAVSDLQGISYASPVTRGKEYQSAIKMWKWVWNISYSLPIALFAAFAYGITFWAIIHWEDLGQKDLPGAWKTVLEAAASLNFLCSLAAVFSLRKVRRNNQDLKKYMTGIMEVHLKKTVKPVVEIEPPESPAAIAET